MPLYLTESDVQSLLDMPLALEALDEVFKARARGDAYNNPRRRLPTGSGAYNFMAASWPAKGVVGHKSYAGGRGGVSFHVMIYGTSGEGLLAVMGANRLGQVRTGAASGLATRYMALEDAADVAVIGSGYQAETQLEAVAAVRSLKRARVYSRTPERRNTYAERMSERLGIKVSPSESAESCVSGADVVIVITNSVEPVLTGDMIAPGVHVNAAGNNSWMKSELDTAAVAKADIVAVDDVDQAKIECGELMRAAETGRFSWDTAIPLADIAAGLRSGRSSATDVTLFESQGVALEDVAVAERIYRLALERGVGTELPA
ncbi:MAG: ornithine cyclodeaminase family protein [Dehalococcoidia bacterium]